MYPIYYLHMEQDHNRKVYAKCCTVHYNVSVGISIGWS